MNQTFWMNQLDELIFEFDITDDAYIYFALLSY